MKCEGNADCAAASSLGDVWEWTVVRPRENTWAKVLTLALVQDLASDWLSYEY